MRRRRRWRSRRHQYRWWYRRLRRSRGTWILAAPLILIVVIAMFGSGPVEARRYYMLPDVLDAIRHVESSGRDNPPDGDGGRAIGPYQIHEVYWRDAIEQAPELGGTYQDCRSRAYAERILEAYMTRWVAEAWRRGDAEVIARTHNGGPRGARRESTRAYWQRVDARLRATVFPPR